MKNKKIKIAYLLTTFIFLFTYIGGVLGNIKSYAYDDTYVALVSTTKPSSGSFKSSTKSSTKNYSTKQKSTIKPDSGSFSTKPNTSTNNSGSSSTIKEVFLRLLKIIIVIVVITILTLIMIMMTMEVEPLRNLYLEEVTTEDIVHLEESILDME